MPSDSGFGGGGGEGSEEDALWEWLERTSESKGVTKAELIDELMSSYWIMDELSTFSTENDQQDSNILPEGMTDDSASEKSPSGSSRQDERESRSSDHEPDGASSEESPKSGSGVENFDDSLKSFIDVVDGIGELKKTLNQLENDTSESKADSPQQVPPTNRESTIESTTVAELKHRIDELSSDVENIQAKQNQQIDEVTDDLQRLVGAVEDVKNRTEGAATKRELSEALEEVSALRDASSENETEIEELRESHRQLESQIQSELDEIEDVFNHLFDQIEKIQSKTDDWRENYDEDMRQIRNLQFQLERVAELKQKAARLDIQQGECDNCGEDINLSLIEFPRCPDCDATLDDIEKGGWNPFKSAKIRTTPPEAASLDRNARDESFREESFQE